MLKKAYIAMNKSDMLRRIEMVVWADQKIHTAAKRKSKSNE